MYDPKGLNLCSFAQILTFPKMPSGEFIMVNDFPKLYIDSKEGTHSIYMVLKQIVCHKIVDLFYSRVNI